MLKISFGRLSTKVLGDLAQRVLNVLLLLTDGILKNNPLVAALSEKNERYQEVVIKKNFSGKGNSVSEQDLLRDKLYRRLRRLLKIFADLPDATRQTHAAALLTAFREAGSINNLSYSAQNTVMRKLLHLLSSDENKAHMTALQLTADFEALEKSQTDFEAIANLQSDENSALRQLPSASAIRHELEDALRSVFALISGMRNVPGWADLYADVNELLKEARQSSRKEKSGTNAGDSSEK